MPGFGYGPVLEMLEARRARSDVRVYERTSLRTRISGLRDWNRLFSDGQLCSIGR